MLKDALIIFRKELSNVFRDRRVIFSNFILPVLLMVVILGAIGLAQRSQDARNREKTFSVAIAGQPNQEFANKFAQSLQKTGLKYDIVDTLNSVEALSIVFPETWDGKTAGAAALLSYDTSRQDLQFAAGKIREAVASVNESLAAEKLKAAGLADNDLHPLSLVEHSLAQASSEGASIAATLLPYLIIIMVFSGSLGLGMATTAGEKENGSLASLLVNQVSRSSIAMGKVFAIMFVGLINAVMNGLGIVIGLGIMTSSGDAAGAQQAATSGSGGANMFLALAQPGTLVILFLSLLMTSAIASSVVVYLGTLAKNMKEAAGYIMPVFIIVVAGAVLTMNMDVTKDLSYYAIPLINVVFLFKAAILSSVSAAQLLIALAVNIAVASCLVALISREFNSERVLYSA